MDLYGQDVELRLLSKFVPRLERRTAIDVGAERGAFATGLLDAGVEKLYAFEPHPENAIKLRTRFAGDRRVAIHEAALSDSDGQGELHISTHPDGTRLSFGHTFLSRTDTAEIAWPETISVSTRSLKSLTDAGEIPGEIGILKIDTEGHDLDVVRGLGALMADVIMVEHWKDLPNSLGACPWTTEEMVQALAQRGYSHFACVVHRGEFVSLKWDDGEVEPGAMGNLVFLHDRVIGPLLPEIIKVAAWTSESAVAVGQQYMRIAHERMALISELEQVASDRLAIVDEIKEAADDRLRSLERTTAELARRSVELESLRASCLDESVD